MATDTTPTPDDPFFSRAEAARYLGLSRQTLAEWACTGKHLPFLKLGDEKRSAVRYRKSDLDAFIKRQTIPASA